MSVQRTVVTLTAIVSVVMIGAGIGAVRAASVEDLATRATTTTTEASPDNGPNPRPVRVEGATATHELSAIEELAAAQHEVAWLRLALAESSCERDRLAAELEEARLENARGPDGASPGPVATCSQP